MKFLSIVAPALLTLSVSSIAAAQEPSGFHQSGALLDPATLPDGSLAKALKLLDPSARLKALRKLSSLSFPALDAATSMRVSRAGSVYYLDTVPKMLAADAAPAGALHVSMPPDKVFSLHSKPSSTNRVYLNFLGERLANRALTNDGGVLAYFMQPFSLDDNPANISQKEANFIAEVWKNVSEDYSPFDVDVTTERPPAFGATSAHVLITPHVDRLGQMPFDDKIGGFGYIGVWGMEDYAYYQPALVFSDILAGSPKLISEAVSHELGHNLALTHDGSTVSEEDYYRGQGSGKISWSPIMGASYATNVTQWSKGEYANANNRQDDITMIGERLGFSPDDHPDQPQGATRLEAVEGKVTSAVIGPGSTDPDNNGVLNNRADIDYFYFDVPGPGTVDLMITPDWVQRFQSGRYRSSNADIGASLYNSRGGLVAKSNPPKDTDAHIIAPLSSGRYFLAVEGVGAGSPDSNGYSDYGSLGQYFISGIIPSVPQPNSPAAVPLKAAATFAQGKP